MKISFAGHDFLFDSSGALYWPLHSMLIIADAHLEKGSSFASRGYTLPPYDSHATLSRVEELCGKFLPRQILILGDFFHDTNAYQRLSPESLQLFQRLQTFPIIWVKGNHDLDYKPEGVDVYDEFEKDGIIFRHEALKDKENEISGHFHPKSEFTYKGEFFRGRCFIEDGKKLILPAFGAYTGGLSIKSNAISQLFSKQPRSYIIINDTVLPTLHSPRPKILFRKR